MFDKIGNASADKLAVEASLLRDLHPSLVRRSEDTVNFAVSGHKEMVNILLEWQEHVEQLPFLYNKNISPPPLPGPQ